MKWATAAAGHPDLDQALSTAAGKIRQILEDDPADLVFAYVGRHHRRMLEHFPDRLRQHLEFRTLAGCSASAVIGNPEEIRIDPTGISLVAARLPEVECHAIHLRREDLPDLDGSPSLWKDHIGRPPEKIRAFFILADPFSYNTGQLLEGLDFAYPDVPKLGGNASGATGRGGNHLFSTGQTHTGGAVMLSLSGRIRVDSLIARGCRPIGEAARITRCRDHLLEEVDGIRPAEWLFDQFSRLDDYDRELIRRSFFLGIQNVDYRTPVTTTDYLIRNIIGLDRSSGTMAVGTRLHEGQRIRFHVKDERMAEGELRRLLRAYRNTRPARPVHAALLFSCQGKGIPFAGSEHVDSRILHEEIQPSCSAGFFCNGEIAGSRGRTRLHGCAGVFALLRDPAHEGAGAEESA